MRSDRARSPEPDSGAAVSPVHGLRLTVPERGGGRARTRNKDRLGSRGRTRPNADARPGSRTSADGYGYGTGQRRSGKRSLDAVADAPSLGMTWVGGLARDDIGEGEARSVGMTPPNAVIPTGAAVRPRSGGIPSTPKPGPPTGAAFGSTLHLFLRPALFSEPGTPNPRFPEGVSLLRSPRTPAFERTGPATHRRSSAGSRSTPG